MEAKDSYFASCFLDSEPCLSLVTCHLSLLLENQFHSKLKLSRIARARDASEVSIVVSAVWTSTERSVWRIEVDVVEDIRRY